jgi:hypothetical protein
LSRLETLKSLESTIENFLTGVVEAEKDKISAFFCVDSLDNIAQDCLKGRYVNNRLGNWFAKGRDLLESNRFSLDEMTAIGNLLDDIKKGLDESDATTEKLEKEIENWRTKGVTPSRKLVLKLHKKPEKEDLLNSFNSMLSKELALLGSGEYDNKHLLTILDDFLKSAEFKEDRMFLHLAASMIYYLKMKGYKITPFVKRLKEIETVKLDGIQKSGGSNE